MMTSQPHRPATTMARQRPRPRSVTATAVLQILVALAFLSTPAIGLVYGSAVQAAVDAEVARQGLPSSVLAENGIAFNETGAAILIPAVVAAVLVVLAVLDLRGSRIGRVLTWIVAPLVLLGNFAIVASQAGLAQALEAMFDSSGNPALQAIDVPALLAAADSAYPGWLSLAVDTRFAVVTAGSVLVLVLMALPSARAYFRTVR